ncbi:tetratricopeptide repeat domain-containing protein [Phthorimaea operculella]|nr:tetratricopeptide repeat domain-containing protein [Phthorimaea operculella]
MSLNKLVGGDCGGNNSLVQLSQIVGRDAAQFSAADRMVNEFMAQTSAPQTFNMNALLNNMPEVEKAKQAHTSTVSQIPNMGPQMSKPWMPGPSASFMPMQPMMRPFPMAPQPMFQQAGPSNLQIQYISESELQNTDVRAKAQEYVNKVEHDEEAYNNFMSFMKKISAGEMNFTAGTADGDQKHLTKDEILDEMAEKYKDEWEKLSNVNDYWSSETANGISEEYNFTEGNAMLENKSALDIGKERLKMGDVPGAVLCFEAAVQQQPESAEAWFLLGATQAENEQDPLAITALKKSLAIDPRQLEGYITLAAAYTNENMPKFAFISLLDWLKASKYSDLLPQDVDPTKMDLKDLENHVKSLYLKAAQLNPQQIDPEVQNALGVVFNISQEYDKAVDCFRTALMVNGNDAKLWNRLGATLANSDKSEQAVDAYHQALELEPGFIRARYNVGITCMNLGAHRQAAEHFLVALNQQMKAERMSSDSPNIDNSSTTIWTTLRMVCSFMGEHDIAKLVVIVDKIIEVELMIM